MRIPDFSQCGLCGRQVMFADGTNSDAFPVTRKYRDNDREQGLLAVRCAVCSELPYQIEAGSPFRIAVVGRERMNIIPDCNSEYNYWPAGIGHLLEVYTDEPPPEVIAAMNLEPIEVGFLVEEDVNLIVVAYRRGDRTFNVTPYSWHAHRQATRATPALPVVSKADHKFRLAYVNTSTGKYVAVRDEAMPTQFASTFHRAIHDHIQRGAPDWERYRQRVPNLYELLYNDKVNGLLEARCMLKDLAA